MEMALALAWSGDLFARRDTSDGGWDDSAEWPPPPRSRPLSRPRQSGPAWDESSDDWLMRTGDLDAPPPTWRPRDPATPPPKRSLTRNQILALAGLGTALVLVLGLLAIALLASPGTTGTVTASTSTRSSITNVSTTITGTETGSPTTIPTVTPFPTVPTANGWSPAAPSFALDIAFAPSDSQIVYICGPDPSKQNGALIALPSSHNTPIAVALSTNGGAHYTIYPTPGNDVNCHLIVSPTNPQYVALMTDGLGGGCSPCYTDENLYESTNGGQTWQQQFLPVIAGTQSSPSIGLVTWVGTTLFASIADAPGDASSLPDVAVATGNNGQMKWIDANLVSSFPSELVVTGLAGSATTLYVSYTMTHCASCSYFASTANAGVSWASSQSDQSISVVTTSDDGATLYGTQSTTGSVMLVVSQDGGQTWNPLPAPPGKMVITLGDVLPDGTIFTANGGIGQSGIYRLDPGASTWAYDAPFPAGNTFLTAQANANGHAVALWGSGIFYPQTGYYGPGLQSHAP
jgi:hypothetical protein